MHIIRYIKYHRAMLQAFCLPMNCFHFLNPYVKQLNLVIFFQNSLLRLLSFKIYSFWETYILIFQQKSNLIMKFTSIIMKYIFMIPVGFIFFAFFIGKHYYFPLINVFWRLLFYYWAYDPIPLGSVRHRTEIPDLNRSVRS